MAEWLKARRVGEESRGVITDWVSACISPFSTADFWVKAYRCGSYFLIGQPSSGFLPKGAEKTSFSAD